MAELEVAAIQDNLKDVFEFVNSELKERTDNKTLMRQIKLCVEEIFLNISSYAYHPGTGNAKIILRLEGDPVPIRVSITFIDKGRPFNPLSEGNPDTESDLDERQVGGLGIFLVKNSADDIYYEFKNDQNMLTFVKEFW